MSSQQNNNYTKDLIRELPSNITDKILEFMPIREAVRTRILSTNWRYRWTLLPQLVFDKEFFDHLKRKQNIQVSNIISEILFLHDGPIRKFSICEPIFFEKHSHDLGHWMLFLSRVGVKEIILYCISPSFIVDNLTKLPSSFFSCQELTYLDLRNFIFKPPGVFRGFKHLTTLILRSVVITSDVFETLVSAAVQLKILACVNCISLDNIRFQAPNLNYMSLCGMFKSILIDQSPYLSVASIKLSKPKEYYFHDRSVSVVKITDHWPKLKKLVIGYYALKIFAAVVDLPESFSTRLNHLEHLHFDHTYFQDVDQFLSLFCLIRSSPNLQKLEIFKPSFYSAAIEPIANFMKEKDFNECRLDQLRIIKMADMKGSSPELELLKYLLSSTPVLETMIVEISINIDPNEELNLTRKLMQFRRISSRAEVIYVDRRETSL